MPNVTRKNNIHFMVNDAERDVIHQRMEEAGINNMRAFMLKIVTDGQIVRMELDSVKEMVRLLSNATNNINQIAKRANQTGNIYAADVEELRVRYEGLWAQAKEILRILVG